MFQKISIVLLSLFMVSCAGKSLSGSGFTGSYRGFEESKAKPGLLSWQRPGAPITNYTKVYIEPSVAFYREGADYQGINPTEVQRVTTVLREKVIAAFGDAYEIVDGPGTDTLTVRTAVTNLEATNPMLQAPQGRAAVREASSLPALVEDSLFAVGDISLEGEFVDSMTLVRLGAVVDRQAGAEFMPGMRSTSWSEVERVFDAWAWDLRYALDAFRAR